MNDTNSTDEITERLLTIIGGLGPRLHQPGLDASTLRALAEGASKELHEVANPPTDGPLFAQADSLIDDLLSDYAKRQGAAMANGGIVGVRTGLDHLDETLNGLEPGKLYMLAAMPGTGKTTLALQWAATVAQAGQGALYISLENDATDLARKTACRLGDVSYAAALKGKLSRQEWAAAVDKLRKLQGRLYLSTPRTTMPTLTSLVEGIMTRTGAAPALIVVDYLQAMVKRQATGAQASDVRERIDRFTPELRAIGEQYECAVLAISSQNRAGYVGGGMAAMKESGDIEYNSDAVLTLSKLDDKEIKERAYDITQDPRTIPLKLVVEKNRQGMTGRPIALLLDGDHCMVEEDR
jgi:replicative DNA helicase